MKGSKKESIVLKACSDLVSILRTRKNDLVTPIVKAAVHVNPKYVCCKNPFACENSSESFQKLESCPRFVNATSQGTAAEKAGLNTNIVLQAANVRSKQHRFGSDIADNSAKK